MKKNTMLLVGGIAVAGVLWYRHQAAAAPAPTATGLDGILDVFRTAIGDGRLLGLSPNEGAVRASARAWVARWGNPLKATRAAYASLYRSHKPAAWPWLTDELMRAGAPKMLCDRAEQDARTGYGAAISSAGQRTAIARPLLVPRGSARRYLP